MALLAGQKRPFSSLRDYSVTLVASPIQRALSEASSTPATPPPLRLQWRTFDPQASVVLVGAPRTGKKTLGVIASRVCHRRLIFSLDAFKDITGLSSAAYRKEHGQREYRKRYIQVLERVLNENDRGAIIVCSGNPTKEEHALLSAFATSHPIVLVTREVASIEAYLKASEKESIGSAVDASERMLRTCSNLEFFNLSETRTRHGSSDSSNSTLALKYTEQHFLKFLSDATGMTKVAALEDTCPLSRVNIEHRVYTYVVSIAMSHLLTRSFDIEKLEQGADAFGLIIDSSLGERFSLLF
jgi:shikimate kinase